MDCAICESEVETQEKIWYAYSSRLVLKDSILVAQRLIEGIEPEQVQAHLFDHPWAQPAPSGKFIRSLALQEALSTFPRFWMIILRALYRAKGLSKKQIYEMFYLDRALDSEDMRKQVDMDLRHLVFRSYLYQHHPENKGVLHFDDAGPYYFLNRQSIPLVEKLEGLEATKLEFGNYITSLSQIQDFNLEHDKRFLDTLIALRSKLYNQEFTWKHHDLQVHLAIENWYAPIQLIAQINLPNGQSVNFSPAAMIALQIASRDGKIAGLTPLWLEYDRGIDDLAQVAESILSYGLYYASETYKNTFPRLKEHGNPGPLICICENAFRRDEVIQTLKGILPSQAIPLYFTDKQTFSQNPYANDILINPQQPEQRWSLLDRVLVHNQTLLEERIFALTDSMTIPSTHDLLSATKRTENPQSQNWDFSAWQGG